MGTIPGTMLATGNAGKHARWHWQLAAEQQDSSPCAQVQRPSCACSKERMGMHLHLWHDHQHDRVQYTCAYDCACKHTDSKVLTWSLLLPPALRLALRARGFWSWSLRFSLLLRAASCTRAALLPVAGVVASAESSTCAELLARPAAGAHSKMHAGQQAEQAAGQETVRAVC
jgi:hypothetical protein